MRACQEERGEGVVQGFNDPEGKGGSSVAFLLYRGPVLGLEFMVSSVSLKGLFLSTPALPWVSMVVIKMS